MNNSLKSEKGGILKVLGILLIIILILLGLALGIGYAFISDKLSNVNYVDIDEANIELNSGVEQELKDYRNID